MAIVLDGTNGISNVDGSAAAPAFKNQDTNTGLSGSADQIVVSTGGSERFRVASAGQLGIAGANYGTSGQVLKSGGASAAPSWGAAGGITVADEWRVTAGTTVDTGDVHISSNWERVDTAQQGTIGSAMSESSGTFTFPSTGIWQVAFTSTGHSSSTEQDFVYVSLRVGGAEIAFQYSNCHGGGNVYYHARTDSLVDVDDTSADTVKFYMTAQSGSVNAHGSSTANKTYATFIRLGDT
jgi:hypothetical protein